ncbi:hypothetical protein [Thiohalocapsa marina]|uniref:hypothetical protein n=1 Tax=Thiohalocapsa marina TaxID=424902 RepID=UPI0036D9BC47
MPSVGRRPGTQALPRLQQGRLAPFKPQSLALQRHLAGLDLGALGLEFPQCSAPGALEVMVAPD